MSVRSRLPFRLSYPLRVARLTPLFLALVACEGCSHDRPRAPAPTSTPPATRAPRTAEVVTPKDLAPPPYRASLGKGAELYIPPWFTARRGGYDLLVHFHGLGRWQEANIEQAGLNVAVVSVNLGAGTTPYSKAFKSPDAFERLLADAHAEIMKSGRAGDAQLRRLALSAWSAGFSSIARVLTDDVAERVDAILLADGFFTAFREPKKRTIDPRSLEKFKKFAEAARRGEKLFAITHTTIPTGPYPSVQECVAKLLEILQLEKTPAVAIGPREMRQFYVVDDGSFHIKGYEGTSAKAHIRQLHAMGETIYPYLKERWDEQDAVEAASHAATLAPAKAQ